ncbi:MAG: TIGR03557 family F420-dependent LLM class oxidoreductase [Thaumarchaeota archaeon]|nr:TIGR03557 family F420-dependent LLM class oxidoreductase [Nitrososphaerota archaeon]
MRPLLIGLNSASEQFTPLDLIERGIGADQAGFDSFWVSDHFHPWFHTGAHSSFSWEVIAAMTARSDRLVMGTSVTAPLFRYNPAIVAQAFSTLSYLAPGRIWLGMATGEGLNEVPLGYQWPRSHAERIRRLREATVIIRLLWTKEFVTFNGEYYKLNRANLYDKPQIPIPIHLSAFGPRSAELAGELGDGLMTVGPMDPTKAREVLFPAVERGARLSGRRLDDVEKSIVLGLGFDHDREKAIDALLPWRGSMLPEYADSEVHDPRVIEENGNRVGRDSIEKHMVIATSAEDVISAVERHVELGFDHIGLALSGDLPAFLDAAKREVLPYFRDEYKERRFNGEYRGRYGRDNLERLLDSKDLAHRIG